MEERVLPSIAFAFGGFEFVYWAMRWAGSNHPRNPAWQIVSTLHLVTWGCVLVAALLLAVEFFRSPGQGRSEANGRDSKLPIDPKLEEEKRQAILLEKEAAEEKVRQRENERLKLIEIQKQEILEAKRKRTAIEAVQSALDDFL